VLSRAVSCCAVLQVQLALSLLEADNGYDIVLVSDSGKVFMSERAVWQEAGPPLLSPSDAPACFLSRLCLRCPPAYPA